MRVGPKPLLVLSFITPICLLRTEIVACFQYSFIPMHLDRFLKGVKLGLVFIVHVKARMIVYRLHSLHLRTSLTCWSSTNEREEWSVSTYLQKKFRFSAFTLKWLSYWEVVLPRAVFSNCQIPNLHFARGGTHYRTMSCTRQSSLVSS